MSYLTTCPSTASQAAQAAQAAALSATNAANATGCANSVTPSLLASNSTASSGNMELRADSVTSLPNHPKVFNTTLRRSVPSAVYSRSVPSSNSKYYSNHQKYASVSNINKSSCQNNSDTESICSSSMNHNRWNELNNNSSNIAMAAASSIAHQKPKQFVSYNTSPKLIRTRRPPPSSSPSSSLQVSPKMKQSSQFQAQNGNPINEQIKAHDNSDLQSLRKPPPLLPFKSQDGVSIHENLSNSNVSIIDNSNNSYNNNSSSSNVYSTNRHSNSTSMLNTQSSNYSSFSTDSVTKPNTTPTSVIPSYYNNQSIDDLPTNYTSTQQLKFKTTLRNNNNTASNSTFKNKSNFSKINSKSKSIKNKISNGNSSSNNYNTEFNENKPWKNHHIQFLNIITSDERKRYEGVFAANRSVYIQENNIDKKNIIKKENKNDNASYHHNNNKESAKNDITNDNNGSFYEDGNDNVHEEFLFDKNDNEKATMKFNQNNKDKNRTNTDDNASNNDLDVKRLDGFINSYSSKSQRISGIVVHDIWIRSKLDSRTLSKIWTLLLDDRKRRWFKLFINLKNDNNNSTNTTNSVNKDDENAWVINGLNEISRFIELDNNMDNGICNKSNDGNENDECFIESETVEDSKLKPVLLQPPVALSSESMKSSTSVISPKTAKSVTISRECNNQKETKHLSSLEPQRLKAILDSNRSFFDDGTLTCEEFIVGMWLIDQCLYGRKLPKIIPLSVWETIGVDWTLSTGVYGTHRTFIDDNHSSNHHHNVPIVSDLVGIGMKTGKSSKRGVFKKVMGKK